ncbi:MAG: hypothetical protein CL567_03350 [Alphaproteobacteria bacterium]|nr:hypothetical protein [Alphaproteobacteria bacterium]|tara:strand:- start:9191 stop:9988 length:798 start_codon:yes stop_codon:yes gene_type:complete
MFAVMIIINLRWLKRFWLTGLVGMFCVCLMSVDSKFVFALNEPLHIDISSKQIEIDSTFSGTSILLFGAKDRPGDIIVIFRGPNKEMIMRRKERKFGIWVNHEAINFKNVPQFYALAASNKPELLLENKELLKYEVGLNNLAFDAAREIKDKNFKEFKTALLRVQTAQDLFSSNLGQVNFIDDNLFRVTIDIPNNIPTGNYLIDTLLISNGELISKKITPLEVKKSGFSDQIWNFANFNSEIYAFIALFLSLIVGWLGSLAFRKL